MVVDQSVLDRETIAEYNFTVVARNADNLTASATVTVTLGDVNDLPPEITNAGYVGRIELIKVLIIVTLH